MMAKKLRKTLPTVIFILLPLICFTASLGIGAYPVRFFDVVKILFGQGRQFPDIAVSIVLYTRLPRAVGCVLVGAALAVSGAVFQGMFGNPLADPYTLGVSNGAGFGAGLAIILSVSTIAVQVSAMFFGLLAVLLTFLLAGRNRVSSVTLILSGMLVSALFSSLVSLLKFVADPYEKLPAIEYWLMGSMANVNYTKILMVLPLYLTAMIILLLYRWRINVMCLGSREARSFGINVARDRTVVIVASTVLTALAVSISGIIGWVGIVIPHLARQIVGPDFRRLMPASISLGICFLLLIDDICRTLTSMEIPIGVVTGIVGVPIFIYFLYKKKVRWV